MRRAWVVLGLLAGCAPPADDDLMPETSGNTGLFRDFLDRGKFDEAGHPLNARVNEAERFCKGAGRIRGTRFESQSAGELCRGELAGGRQAGAMVLNLRLAASGFSGSDALITVEVRDPSGMPLGNAELMPDSVRTPGAWMNLPVTFHYDGGDRPVTVVVTGSGDGKLSLDYFELFPADFRLVLSPGSGEFSDSDVFRFESALDAPALALKAGERDLSAHLASLLADGRAKDQSTSFRRIVSVPAGVLLSGIAGDIELHARSGNEAARMQLRRSAPPCVFAGAPNGVKVLATGFQPFPADGWHDNVSRVGVFAARPEAMPGVRLMRIELPVEYDRAAAEVVSAIRRCAPDVVVSFGQGGGNQVALETTAYNLKDTSEVPGGVPDNRGLISAAQPIASRGPATRSSRLPLAAIGAALDAIGQPSASSSDPGRYICNNVFYQETSEVIAITGFVHLPYVTHFSTEDRAHWGQVVETVLSAAAAAAAKP